MEKILSPGVFTRENDKSFIAQGIAQIGAAFIGPTKEGPAFIPTLVESYNDFTRLFGEPDGNSYLPYTVQSYLKNAGRATVVRVLPIAGYSADVAALQLFYTTASVSGNLFPASESKYGHTSLLAYLAPTGSGGKLYISCSNFNTSSLIFDLTASFTEPISASTIIYTGLSIDPASANYFVNVFGDSPTGAKPLYVYTNFKDSQEYLVASSSAFQWGPIPAVSASLSRMNAPRISDGITLTGTTNSPAYIESITPWIQSQVFQGSYYDLFRFHTFSNSTAKVKLTIDNIKSWVDMPTGVDYGTFALYVRDISDTDNRPVILETFNNLTLDPTSPNYIARVIGDQYRVFGQDDDGNGKMFLYGDYVNQSKYIRIEMGTDYPKKAVPLGTDKYYSPITSNANFPAVSYITSQFDENLSFISNTCLGFDFDFNNNSNGFVKLPVSTGADKISTAFNLGNCVMQSGSSAPYSASFDITSQFSIKSRKFSIAFQGGFDGFNTGTSRNMGASIVGSSNIMGFNCGATADGTVAYKKAIDTVSNPDDFDINMLVLPGIIDEYAGAIITYANQMCENRQDVFFLFDSKGITATVNQVVQQVQTKDSNYSATYYPWVKIYDSTNNQYLWAPPSVVIPGVIAFSDKIGAEWWAPAGLNRGGIPEATQVYTRLTQSERDTLYEGRVNPIATFVGQGIVVWGQKTLQFKSSALDRISVRRLLIALKKYIASTSKYLVFEQNTVATRQRFLNMTNPYLESVQQRQGLYAFKVVMDETTNTPDVIDRNMMAGAIYLQPSKTAEMIVIDFNILATGAVFGA